MAIARHPLIIGHRGASGYRPEHTAEAYSLAIDLGADVVEPDLVVTADGVLVVRHENEISDTTDVATHLEFADRRRTKIIDGKKRTGWFTEDFSWSELSTLRAVERLPRERKLSASFDGQFRLLRFCDLLQLLGEWKQRGRRVGLAVEIKHPTYFESIGISLDALVAAELAAAGWTDRSEELIIECFERRVLTQLQVRGVRAQYVYLVHRAGSPADETAQNGKTRLTFTSFIKDEGLAELASGTSLHAPVHGVSLMKDLLFAKGAGGSLAHSDVVRRTHDAGLAVYTWTLRPENLFLNKNFRRGSVLSEWGNWRGEFEFIVSSGVEGVFCDHPDLVRQILSGDSPGDGGSS
ncbi:glycerophosphodiester phosphodiesterase family protein [Lysinibacter sp. HNR]|uniref:glycerophosphodiester phosphodiesterase family protein n=1 Tax=Lysinibacter sp. HNR TaxID=3031408 RepID=UPI002434BC0D|nr:glycerophosphodiester phosphodiesterase family protein [Lysinibacter sp. HNR]WGD38003.1 glycerophosphodiester phosphodiesterase family protein [Lysinibacter sp. HNR]